MNITEDIAEKDITIPGKKYVDILKKLMAGLRSGEDYEITVTLVCGI